MATGVRFTDERIIEAILAQPTDVQAAEVLGCSPKTIRVRRKKPEFQAKLAEARARRNQRVIDETAQMMPAALVRAGLILASDEGSIPGVTPFQLRTLWLKAAAFMAETHFRGWAMARDDQLRALEAEVLALREDLAIVQELLGGGAGERRHATA